jgi:hypothetical protein
MAKTNSGFRLQPIGFNWQTAILAAGIAIIAPFFLRRIMPLLEGGVEDISARDLKLAGKDSVRDVADDLGVGGVTGTIERGIGRVADRLTH